MTKECKEGIFSIDSLFNPSDLCRSENFPLLRPGLPVLSQSCVLGAGGAGQTQHLQGLWNLH